MSGFEGLFEGGVVSRDRLVDGLRVLLSRLEKLRQLYSNFLSLTSTDSDRYVELIVRDPDSGSVLTYEDYNIIDNCFSMNILKGSNAELNFYIHPPEKAVVNYRGMFYEDAVRLVRGLAGRVGEFCRDYVRVVVPSLGGWLFGSGGGGRVFRLVRLLSFVDDGVFGGCPHAVSVAFARGLLGGFVRLAERLDASGLLDKYIHVRVKVDVAGLKYVYKIDDCGSDSQSRRCVKLSSGFEWHDDSSGLFEYDVFFERGDDGGSHVDWHVGVIPSYAYESVLSDVGLRFASDLLLHFWFGLGLVGLLWSLYYSRVGDVSRVVFEEVRRVGDRWVCRFSVRFPELFQRVLQLPDDVRCFINIWVYTVSDYIVDVAFRKVNDGRNVALIKADYYRNIAGVRGKRLARVYGRVGRDGSIVFRMVSRADLYGGVFGVEFVKVLAAVLRALYTLFSFPGSSSGVR